MCIPMNGSSVDLAASSCVEREHLGSSTGDRSSRPWSRIFLVARDAARTAAVVRTLPVAARTRGTRLRWAPGSGLPAAAGGHAPVVLVHGYAATPDCWKVLTERLRAEGFDRVYAFSYNGFTGGLPELGQALVDAVTVMMERSGSDTVHLVGHSFGGLLVRFAAEWLGLWPRALTVVTIATPHHGCPLAWAAPGPAAWWMRPRGWSLPAPVFAEAAGPRYLNFYADRDVVLSRRSARLDLPEVTNIQVAGAGHLGAPRAGAVLDSLPGRFAAAEAGRGPVQRAVPSRRQRAPIAATRQHLPIPA